MSDAPAAVLLDAGGVFVLPDPERILGAFTRAECSVPRKVLADAHYRAAARFGTHLDVEANWTEAWLDYLQTYVDECGVPQDRRDEAHRHLDSEFADAALWVEPVPGSREGLQALADTGVRLGIVSNADGMMGPRLAQLELCQVGPGIGVDIECVVDSGNVGVMKPDPRIFEAALDLLGLDADQVWYVGDMPAIDVVGARRAGIRPFLMDPLGLHLDASYERIPSLAALAELIATSSYDEKFSLASARHAADEGRLAEWVVDFLASPGSSNPALAAALGFSGATYLGPIRFALDRLTPMAGPEGVEVVVAVAEEVWESDVEAMEHSIEQGWHPPPLLVSHHDGKYFLEDGNHRYETMRRTGATHAWTILLFADEMERDRFLKEHGSLATRGQ
jgi:FMN phosphatase YigB (HAD superfamily)